MTQAPKVTRRRFLEIGSGITLVAAAGLLWRANERGVFAEPTGEAYEPWSMWQAPGYANTPLALVAAGILASNPHNTQPWIFRVSATRIDILADTRRHLGTFDPYLREMHVGLGCAVENMVLAAAANGFSAEVAFAPGSLLDIAGRDGQVLAATLRLSPSSAAADPLYDAIPRRHTDRNPYDHSRPLAADAFAGVADEDGVRMWLFDGSAARDRLGAAIIEATEEIVADEQMIEDSHDWFRDGPDEIAREKSGLALDTAGLSPALLAAAKFLPALPAEQSHGAWLNQTRDTHVPTAALLGLIATRDRYDRPQALAAGRLWQRLHLTGAAVGISMHPLNQPVETIDRELQLEREAKSEVRLASITGDESWQPTFVFRAGYPTRQVRLSARRGVKEVTV
ncbi:MAG: hypothetical protein Q7V31_06405 [Parvibaculum sp.]|uniref:Acg family FMN-binding oxidoreductase n=1 Tax=Parvibaculum sp. TaxID=2024848 RepID=UPI002721C8F8|nr:hypothetical protein [Parvibaculum sp.]MDO8838544.1 hypothetical protein [Parvibaculum sp.]